MDKGGPPAFLTSYGYDALGNLLSVTQGSLTRSYAYDALSRLTQEINPESGTTSYTYDTSSARDLYRRTRPKQNQTGSATVVTTYSFDALHRLTGKSYNDSLTSSVALSYDQSSVSGVNLANPKGRLTYAAAGGTASTIFSYDTMGRIAGDWQCTPLNCGTGSFSLQYQYDYLGDVTQFANAREGATYTYSYDTLARLTKLQSSVSDSNHPGTLLTVNTHNPLGEVTRATLGNGIVRNVGYDNRGRLTSLTDGSVFSFGLGFAPDNDIVTGNDSINGNWSYGYDDFNRISASNKNSGQQTFSYVYDRYSNRWQQNAPQGGPAPQYSFNGNNQITGSGVLYDAAGNVTNDGLGDTYTYDAENRLISMSGTNNSASYVYDALGQRVRSTINSTPYDFIYNGGRAIDEVTASNWVWGDAGALQAAVYANATTYFSHSDWLGTVRAWSNVSGGSIGTCTSLAFGDAQTCAGLSPNPWHYTGQPLDSENSLQHFLFRQESAIQGRWMSPDPAGLGAVDHSSPQTWNRYAYVANNPLSYVDLYGLNRAFPGQCSDGQGVCPDEGAGGDPNSISGGEYLGIWGSPIFGTYWNDGWHIYISGFFGGLPFGGQDGNNCYYVLVNPCGGGPANNTQETKLHCTNRIANGISIAGVIESSFDTSKHPYATWALDAFAGNTFSGIGSIPEDFQTNPYKTYGDVVGGGLSQGLPVVGEAMARAGVPSLLAKGAFGIATDTALAATPLGWGKFGFDALVYAGSALYCAAK